MAATLNIEPNETLDSVVDRVRKVNNTDEIVLALPEDTAALRTLDDFNVLRAAVREKGVRASFLGGNRTTRGLAKILGFNVTEGGGGETLPPSTGTVPFPARERPVNPAQTTRPTPTPPPATIQDTFGMDQGSFPNFPTLDVNMTPPPAPPGTSEVRLGQRGQPQPRQPRENELTNGRPLAPGTDFTFDSADFSDVRPSRNGNGSNGNGSNGNGNGFNPAPAAFPSFDEQPPQREFDSPSGSRTMSLDEAMRSGFLRGTNFDPAPSASAAAAAYGRADADESVPDLDFGADSAVAAPVSRGRGRGRNRQANAVAVDDSGAVIAETRRAQSAQRRPNLFSSLSAISTVVRRPRNAPAETQDGTPRATPVPLTSRDAERNRRTLPALFIALAALLITILLIFLTTGGFVIGPGGTALVPVGQNPNPTQGASSTLPPVMPKVGVSVALTAPSANGKEVTLVLQPTSGGASGTVPAGTATSGATAAPNAASGVLPVRTITKTGLTATGTLPGTKLWQQKVGDKLAGGDIYVVNGNNYGIGYRAGEAVMTVKGITYVAAVAVTIPAADLSTGQARSAVFSVVANKSGTLGNTAVGGFYAPGKPNLYIKPSQMTGGSDKTVYQVTEDNAKDAQMMDKLSADVKNQAQSAFTGQLQQGETPAGDVTLGDQKMTLDPPPGTTLDKPQDIKVTYSASITGYAYTQEALTAAVAPVLGLPANANTVVLLTNPKLGKDGSGKQTLNGLAVVNNQGPTQDALKTALANALAGQPVAQAQTIITQVVQRQAPGYSAAVTSPDYTLTTFPSDPSAITITFGDAGAPTTAVPSSNFATTPGISPTAAPTLAPNGTASGKV